MTAPRTEEVRPWTEKVRTELVPSMDGLFPSIDGLPESKSVYGRISRQAKCNGTYGIFLNVPDVGRTLSGDGRIFSVCGEAMDGYSVRK